MAQKELKFQGQGRIYVDPAVSITVPAVSASSLEDLEVTVANAAVGDAVLVSMAAADFETDLGIVGAFVSEAGKVKIRFYNNDSGNAATGGAATAQIILIRQS